MSSRQISHRDFMAHRVEATHQCDHSVAVIRSRTPGFRGHHSLVTEGCIIQAVGGEGWRELPSGAADPADGAGLAGGAGEAEGAGLRELTSPAVRGDPAAIVFLLQHIRPMVVRYCRARLGRITGHYHVADDVAQEVCIAVLAALPRYRDMGR